MSERDRIRFVLERDGREKARAWARQTLDIYRTCLSQEERHYSQTPPYHSRFVDSCLALEAFLLRDA